MSKVKLGVVSFVKYGSVLSPSGLGNDVRFMLVIAGIVVVVSAKISS
ncbi:unnamed protein product [marine sediment metagenome]|uniref:Uncharacterized protein n=1 Tax=marine sediment metagenome TaxID=412755 RepID=X1DHR5_9ZZZZ